MKTLLRAGILCFICLSISFAQNLTVKQVLQAPFPYNLTTSSSKDIAAWVYNHQGARNIWIAEGPKFQEKQISNYTKDDGQEISDLIFTPDDLHIIYVKGGAPNRQGEIPNPRSQPENARREIWKISIQNQQIEKISDGYSPKISPDGEQLIFLRRGQVWMVSLKKESQAKPLFQIRGIANSLKWSPNGNHVAFISNRGDHSFLGVYDLKQKNITYINPTVDTDNSPVWSPDGSKIAFIRLAGEKNILPFAQRREGLPWAIMVADIESGNTTKIWEASKGIGSVFRSISADNQLLWTATNDIVFPWEGDGWTHLYKISDQGGIARCLTPGEFEVQFAYISNDKNNIYYSSNENDIDRQHIWKVNLEESSSTQITSGRGIEWAPVSLNSGQILCLGSTEKLPAHVLLVSQGKKTTSISDLSTYPSEELVTPQQIVFTASDGMSIHGQLFLPSNQEEGKKYPAVLFFHGGSRRQMLLGFHHRGYYHNAYAINQYLANKGYIVLSVNYRSGIGYGMKFREALNYGAQGASEFNDVMGAGLYLKNRKDVDSHRIGLWGGSYGGYLTALGLSRASDLFAAGVDIHGVHDWNNVIKNFVPSYHTWEHPQFSKLAYESSPMASIKGWRSPVLLIHGDDDRNVPFSETVDIVESLRKQNVYFEQLIFPDEVHGFLLHTNWIAAYEAMVDFFERKLKNKQ